MYKLGLRAYLRLVVITKNFPLPAIAIFHHSEHIVSLAGPPDRSLEALGRLLSRPKLVSDNSSGGGAADIKEGTGKMHQGGGPTEGFH